MEELCIPRLMTPCLAGYGRPYYSQFHTVFGDKNTLHKALPHLYEKRCLGSSHGWLIMAESESPSIFAVNPLDNSTLVYLPSLLTLLKVIDCGNSYVEWSSYFLPLSMWPVIFINSHIKKLVLSKDPTVDGCAAAAIFSDQNELVVCRVGDEKWTIFKGCANGDFISTGFRDVVFDRKGEVYAVNSRGYVVAGDPDSALLHLVYKPSAPLGADEKYLAFDSAGGLVLVHRYIGDDRCIWSSDDRGTSNDASNSHEVGSGSECCDSDVGKLEASNSDYDGDDEEERSSIYGWDDGSAKGTRSPSSSKTLRFRVFRLDEERGSVEEVDSLGGEALFVGDSESLCLPTWEFPGCKSDCVYFTDDRLVGRNERNVGSHDNGLFSLKDGSIERFSCIDDNEDDRIWPPPIWVALATNVV